MHTLIRNAGRPDGTARGVREGREVRGPRRALALLLPVERPDAARDLATFQEFSQISANY